MDDGRCLVCFGEMFQHFKRNSLVLPLGLDRATLNTCDGCPKNVLDRPFVVEPARNLK